MLIYFFWASLKNHMDHGSIEIENLPGRCRIDQIANLERGGKCWAKLDQFSPMVFLIRYEM